MLALFLAIPLVAIELVARKLVGDAVAHAVATRIGVKPTIGFGTTPVLLQIVHGRLGAVTVSARGAHIDGLPPLALSATLRDVHLRSLTSLQGAIGSLTVQASLAPAGVRDLLATPGCLDALPAGVLTALTPSPRVDLFPGRVDLLPPRGRTAEVQLRPVVVGASVRFVVTAVHSAGAPLPAGEVALVRADARCSRTLSGLPFGVSPVSATAVRGALVLGFAGSGASFSALG
jgi:hypothetical protein